MKNVKRKTPYFIFKDIYVILNVMEQQYCTSRRSFLKHALMGGMSSMAYFSYAHGALYNPNITELIQFTEGNLPILITAPHGGNELVFGIPARTNITRPVANFTYYGAVWTYEICLTISRTLQRLSGGKKPFMVLNLAHRRYLDVNRENSDAYEVTLNAPRIYWEYHDTVREYVNQMNIIYKNPLLIEITGHRIMPNLIIRRTLNGKSVKRLKERTATEVMTQELENYKEKIQAISDRSQREKALKILNDKEKEIRLYQENPSQLPLGTKEKLDQKSRYFAAQSYSGEKSLIGEIKKRGYKIDPEIGVADIEIPQTTAGNFTLDRYGAHQKIGGMDAIQLIIGSDYRKTYNYQQTGRDIGNAIWSFMQHYNIMDSSLS